jgi:predicted small lipoprotein YifL
MRRPIPGTVFGVLILLAAVLAGCGRKMPPIAPGAYPPPAVKQVSFERQQDRLTLFWTRPLARSEKESPAVGFRVLRARQTASEAECRTCRLRYETAGEVRAAAQDLSERIQFEDRLEPGYDYYYKVISFSADGLESKESASVHPTE